jgi:hypothetical protein
MQRNNSKKKEGLTARYGFMRVEGYSKDHNTESEVK